MTSTALRFEFEFKPVTCCNCGMSFAMSAAFYRKRREDRGTFHCPQGHPQHFSGKTEAQLEIERKEKEVANLRQRLAWSEKNEERQRKEAAKKTRQAAAYKGIVTKTKRRVGNGVCPCCNRTFENLQRHMTTKHPTYKKAKK